MPVSHFLLMLACHARSWIWIDRPILSNGYNIYWQYFLSLSVYRLNVLRKSLFKSIYSFENCVPGINKGLLKNQRTMTVTKHTKTLISWNVIGPNASCLSFMTFFISLSFSSFGTSSSKGSSPFAYYIFRIVNDLNYYYTRNDL